MKILNHYRNSSRYINRIAEFSAPFDAQKVYESVVYGERFIKFIPNQKMAYGVLGYSHYLRGDRVKAIDAYEKAAKFLPEYFGFHYDLGVLYYRNGQYKEAIDKILAFLVLTADVSFEHNLKVAESMLTSDELKKAWVVSQGMKYNEAFVESVKILIQCYDHLKQYSLLYQSAQKSLEAQTADQPFYHFYAGKAAYHLGLYREAFEHMTASLKMNDNNMDAIKYLGRICEKIGKEDLFADLMMKYKLDPANSREKDLLDVNDVKLIYYIPLYELGIIPLSDLVDNAHLTTQGN